MTSIPAHSMRVAVLGQGYVGLPLAMRAVDAGYHVVGLEPDAGRLSMLQAGQSYVEDVPSLRLAAAVAGGRYKPSADPADLDGFDVGVIAVPTPLRDGAPDLGAVEAASHSLGSHLRRHGTVVLESTTYPGTTEEVVGPILAAESGLRPGKDFHLGYSSERIDPGNRVWTLVNTPKLVSGVDPSSLRAVAAFYTSVVDTVVEVSSPKVAEMAKLIENTFRHVNIALVNELAMFASELDIDIWDAIDAAATKPFGFMRFEPGPGVGGHCLPVDPSYLAWRVRTNLGRSFRFVELANDINDHMPEYVVRRVTESLNRRRRSVAGSRLLLLGLAYKRNSGDCRESPGVRVATMLADLGAEVRAADPHVAEPIHLPGIVRVDATPDEYASADLVVVLTDHDAFDLDGLSRCGTPVLDTRCRVPGEGAERL